MSLSTSLSENAQPSSIQPNATQPTTGLLARRFSRPRFALLVLLGVYPLITALLYVIFPLTDGWTVWQRTMVIAPLMVILMIYGLIPWVQKNFSGFLNVPA